MERVEKFLKEAEIYYLATVEGDQPRVRPFGTIHRFEGKLYIQTGKVQDVSKQIHANPKTVSGFAWRGNLWKMIAEKRDSPCWMHIPPCRKCILQMMATRRYSISKMQPQHFLHLHMNRKL